MTKLEVAYLDWYQVYLDEVYSRVKHWGYVKERLEKRGAKGLDSEGE